MFLEDFANWLGIALTDLWFLAAVFGGIVLGSLLAGWFVRVSIKRLLRQQQAASREQAANTLIKLSLDSRKWAAMSEVERELFQRTLVQVDTSLRLMPERNTNILADWSTYLIQEMRGNPAAESYTLDPTMFEFRDRVIAWVKSPRKALKDMKEDLGRWGAGETASETYTQSLTGIFPTQDRPVFKPSSGLENSARDVLKQVEDQKR